MERKRIRDFGIVPGVMKTGPKNKITDVPGVLVGHKTVRNGDNKTGVTVIVPGPGNVFERKFIAAGYVHNGFGKTCGLVQVEELGTLETPIALTNTLNVGKVHDALVDYMVEQCERDGVELTSMNPVVGECNDASLNKITERVIGIPEVRAAIDGACRDFEEGDVGAGKGTTCFGMKGGIGSASRLVELDGKTYVVGVLVQSNFGKTKHFVLDGKPLGELISGKIEEARKDEGSIMMVVGTDLPVSDRQLKRIIRRAGVGLSRCGSFMGHGSGDIMLGFSTGNVYRKEEDRAVIPAAVMNEAMLDDVFEAAAEATEEAVLNSLAAAHTVTGYKGNTRYSLTDLYLKDL